MPANSDAQQTPEALAAWMRIRSDALAARRIRQVPQRPRPEPGSKRS